MSDSVRFCPILSTFF